MFQLNGAADTSAISEEVEEIDAVSEVLYNELDSTPTPDSLFGESTERLMSPPSLPTTTNATSSRTPARPTHRGEKRVRDSVYEQLDLVLTRNWDTRERLLKLKLESRLLEQKEAHAAAALEADKARAHELKVMEMKIQLALLHKNRGVASGGQFQVPNMQPTSQGGPSQLSFPTQTSSHVFTHDSFSSNAISGS